MAEARQSEQTLRVFDAAAPDFAALGRYLWEPIGAVTVAVADVRQGQRVLDACCGTGASAIPAARLVGPSGVVDAVDLSGPMVEQLRARAGGLPQLRAHRADVMGWEGGGYDVVQSALGVFFLPDMVAGTRRLIGMARPGGRVVFTIWRAEAMVAARRVLGRAVAAVTSTDPFPAREPQLIDRINQADSFAGWLTECGLVDVEVTVNELSLTMTPDIAWLVVLGSGYRRALGSLSPDTVDSVRSSYLSLLREEGIAELDATTLIGAGTVGAPATG